MEPRKAQPSRYGTKWKRQEEIYRGKWNIFSTHLLGRASKRKAWSTESLVYTSRDLIVRERERVMRDNI